MTTILAFGAHPDDLEFGCGGILIKAATQGASVHMVVTSRGEAGSAGNPEQRTAETENAAAIVGGTLHWLDFGGDSHQAYTVENKIAIAKLIREIQPGIVLVPFLQENQHPDHAILAKLVRDACRLARYGGLAELKDLTPHRIDALYYYAGTAHSMVPFDVLVDISDVKDQWVQAIRAHVSQVNNKSYEEMLLTRARFLGNMGGVQYALPLWQNDPILVDSVLQVAKGARSF